ncbi:uncharacterized protein LAESUDRAFT_762408 [Laetiporus sulphureus 93-53]|uniref:DUF6533 domain-containing protein n=1 Tax=Laetiporus sulphureus 93-53 TaxID=1314785 RepID=A0A165CKT8_9APHY|nr:uncharacterized protein LAESUDRAFT_762408 [Laetiporus sulphureus 93-53]KZT02990.1 hypothetical protein LAESUDRAFT_762408 [Laetiporus sulphureus 93-53]
MSNFSEIDAWTEINAWTPFLAAKYLSAAAVTVSLYDHVLTLHDEIDLVWRQPWNTLQTVVMLNRYGGELSICFIAYVALLLRAYSIWDSRSSVKYAFQGGFVLCIVTSFACAVAATQEAYYQIGYSSVLKTCALVSLTPEGHFVELIMGSWGALVLLDVYVFVLIALNAMSKPRRRDSEILSNLYRDGVLTFFAFFALRLLQFLPSTIGKLTLIFLTPIIAWSLDNVLSFRLLLKLKMKAVEIKGRRGWRAVTNYPSVYIMEEVEMEEL